MKNSVNIVSTRTKINFYLNLVNFLPFIILILSGFIIQINYHMHRLPDDYIVLGLSRQAWLPVHKLSAVITLTGCLSHCALHWKYIKTVTKNFLNRKSEIRIYSSYYLLIIAILTAIPAIISWFFLNTIHHLRFMLVEIHDKLAILFMIISIVHLISRSGWMFKIYRRIK